MIVKEIKDDDGNGIEVWYARELQNVLDYAPWEKLISAIGRAMESCKTLNINVDDHFREITKMIGIAKGAQCEVLDFMLTRYACYLIVQNGDPKKEEIAFAQSYFAVQTRKAEMPVLRQGERGSHAGFGKHFSWTPVVRPEKRLPDASQGIARTEMPVLRKVLFLGARGETAGERLQF